MTQNDKELMTATMLLKGEILEDIIKEYAARTAALYKDVVELGGTGAGYIFLTRCINGQMHAATQFVLCEKDIGKSRTYMAVKHTLLMLCLYLRDQGVKEVETVVERLRSHDDPYLPVEEVLRFLSGLKLENHGDAVI